MLGKLPRIRIRGESPVTGRKPDEGSAGVFLHISAIYEYTLKKRKSGFFKIQVAMAVTLLCDLLFMIYAGTFNGPVLLFVPAPDPAGAVGSAEL
jgi:hypothetical protein